MAGRNKYNLKLSSLSVRRNKTPTIDSTIDGTIDGEESQDDEDGLLLNILPSYQMYQSTVSKNLTPTTDDLRTDPPSYELTPQSSSVSDNPSIDYFGSVPASPSQEPVESSDSTINQSDDTILENVHKLKRLTSINKELSKSLDIKIFLTEKIGKIGEVPNIIDPLGVEFKQGDYIFGYILVTNKTTRDIPFDMFSVVLEGSLTFGNTKNSVVSPPSHIVRFLNMFDFNASWNDACLDRLSTEHHNPYVPVNEIDPIDNTHVNFYFKKIFQPGITYKKFFTFKMPQKLLDSTCEHGFIKHLQIPSSLGISKNEIITALRQKWKEPGDLGEHNHPSNLNHGHHVHSINSHTNSHASASDESKERSKHSFTYASSTNDFAFADCSINFSISARIIGKASDYDHIVMRNALPHLDPAGDEYVVANEDYCYLRVIPVTNPIFESNRSMIDEEAKLLYTSMVTKIKDIIAYGKELQQERGLSAVTSNSDNPLQPVTSGSSITSQSGTASHSGGSSLQPTHSSVELAKMQQTYYKKVNPRNTRTERENVYEVFVPYKKKSMFGSSKILGLLAFSTPKKIYKLNYVPVKKFMKPGQSPPSTEINIPLDLNFVFSDNHSAYLPDLRKITVELVCLTIKSKHYPIPVVFHPDMLFENKSKGTDNFDLVTLRPFQKYAMELSKLIRDVGYENLEIEKDLIQNVKCLANLSTKYDHLKIKNPKVQGLGSGEKFELLSSIPWETETLKSTNSSGKEEEQIKYFKKFNLNIDIKNATPSVSSSPDFCLVPDFQSCLMSRLYYLKINVKCPNGDKISMRVPIVIQKDA